MKNGIFTEKAGDVIEKPGGSSTEGPGAEVSSLLQTFLMPLCPWKPQPPSVDSYLAQIFYSPEG